MIHGSFLEFGDHLLCLMAMFADQDVNVVGHDRTGVAGVPIANDDFMEYLANRCGLDGVQFQQRMGQDRSGLAIEFADLRRGGLNLLPPVMQFAQFRDYITVDGAGGAPPWIVG